MLTYLTEVNKKPIKSENKKPNTEGVHQTNHTTAHFKAYKGVPGLLRLLHSKITTTKKITKRTKMTLEYTT